MFRQRNRIVSGLSLGILVIEAEARSGTSITARYAMEQGKDVFCIPNSIDNRKGIGTNNLIKKGAKLILNPNEIIEKYIHYTQKQITIDDLESMHKITAIRLNDIKEEYRCIYEILTEPLSINDISEKIGIDITEIYSKIFMMEIEGLIKKEGNKYIIS